MRTTRKQSVATATTVPSPLDAPDAEPENTPGGNKLLPVCLADYETLAQRSLSHSAWEYYSSGSADESTLQWNREAFARIRLKPTALVDVSHVDMSTRLFGHHMPHPILLAPTSSHFLANPEGEVATVRGAGAANATLIVSTLSNRSIEDIARAATAPIWFQLYVQSDRVLTQDLVHRAEAAGCRALCITVDLPLRYARTREDRVVSDAAELPFPNLNLSARPGGKGRKEIFNRGFNWRDLEWIQSFAKTPVLLKGILNPDDADRAAKSGVAGIIVSNHGGRALDSVPASIDALPYVADKVAGRIPLLMDGGIRRGTDILKALAHGASAVLVGRPYLYALAVAGSDGVTHVVEILKSELEAAMALCGCTSLRSIDRSVLWP